MKKLITTAVLAVALASTAALAQTTAPGTSMPKAAPPAVSLDAGTEAKFKAADKDGNGMLDGAEVTAYKSDMSKIDTDKDGKISRGEFAAASKSGVIK